VQKFISEWAVWAVSTLLPRSQLSDEVPCTASFTED